MDNKLPAAELFFVELRNGKTCKHFQKEQKEMQIWNYSGYWP